VSIVRRPPRCGDWVKATGTIPVTFTDHLLTTTGIRPGTRGVVVAGPCGWLRPTATVRFDTGLGGTCEVNTPLSKIRVSRRNGGIERFTGRAHWMGLARLGVALALCAPVLYFVLVYLWTFRTFEGLVPALMTSALDSAVAMVGFVLTRPVEAATFLILTWLLGRFAFR